MRTAVLLVVLIFSLSSRGSQTPSFPIQVSGSRFADADGRPFAWRGITAFRLAEMVASGREQDAAAYLEWAQREGLTVVRVLLMAKHLFSLSPEDGRSALSRLLDLAKERGIAVEAVALADTREYRFDHQHHIKEIGRIALDKGNAFVEIANEPGHPTQDRRVHDPAYVSRLAGLLPESLVVALGSVEYGEGFTGGDYATFHFSRGKKAWDHVLELSAGARRVSELRKPIVSDEPIGAGPEYQPGRRDNEPSRFAAAAALTRLSGMEATFHYESGLQARIPQGREAECLDAWQAGLALLDGVPLDGEFVSGSRLDALVLRHAAKGVYARISDRRGIVLAVGPTPAVTLISGWREERRRTLPGVLLVEAVR